MRSGRLANTVSPPSTHDNQRWRAFSGFGVASVYGVALGLTFTACLGWPFVAAYTLLAGPWLGRQWATSHTANRRNSGGNLTTGERRSS